ncbi:MAG: nicotinamide-nucleotide amidohydrolase family protein [Spirochaetales bacterium]|nr:nicotinamide-nucleotide amidohydrolase family protein [Spirochaetales bacterium]
MNTAGFSLSCAESCTGGLAAAALTAVPGASSYFLGGVVAYSNDVKIRLLGVDTDTISSQGAVSATTALEMADGVARVMGADCSFAITGVAGPEGGTDEKPVGTVWFGFRTPAGSQAEMLVFDGGRDAIRVAAATHAMTRIAKLCKRPNELDNTIGAGVSFP